MGLIIGIGEGISGLIIPPALVKISKASIYVKSAYELSYEGKLYVGLFRYRSSGYGGTRYRLINDTALSPTPDETKIKVVKFNPDSTGWMRLPYTANKLFRRFVFQIDDSRYKNNTRFHISGRNRLCNNIGQQDLVPDTVIQNKYINTRISGIDADDKYKQAISVSLAFAFCYFGKFNEADYTDANFAGRKRVTGEYTYCKLVMNTIPIIRFGGFNFINTYKKML